MVEQVGALETSIRLLKWCGALSAIEWESSGNNQWLPRSTRPSSGARCYDVGVHFVDATYYLEGDEPLIFACFKRLSAVSHAVTVGHYPCTLAIAREIANGHADLQNRLITQSKDCVQPGLNFFQSILRIQWIHRTPFFITLVDWHNSLLKVGKKPIYYKSWSSKGIQGQAVDERRKPISILHWI